MLKTSFVFSALLWCLAGSPATAATCVTVYPGMCVMLDTNSYEAMPVPESRGTSSDSVSPFEASFVWFLVLWAPLPHPAVGHNNHPAYYARFQTEERCEAVAKLVLKEQPRGTKLECQNLSTPAQNDGPPTAH
jgi:hypothetical protein